MALREIRSDENATELLIDKVKMSPTPCWQNLPHHVFGDIMTMMGGERLNDLQKFRQVCQSWNVMLSQMTKLEKDNIRGNVESLAAQIRENIIGYTFLVKPGPPMMVTTASLAHHGMLDSVKNIVLLNLDLTSVPTEHLAALASCVTGCVVINNVSNYDLNSFLASLKCPWLGISNQTLSSEETRALVWAMESGVEDVKLGNMGEVSLDITALTQYSGEGKCLSVTCYDDTAERYKVKVRIWARRINWRVLDAANRIKSSIKYF